MLFIMSARAWPKDFSDRLSRPLPGPREFLALSRQGGFRGREHPEREAGQIPCMRQPLPALTAEQTSITWIGHASYVIRALGMTVLTDPVWSESIPGRIRRLNPPGSRGTTCRRSMPS